MRIPIWPGVRLSVWEQAELPVVRDLTRELHRRVTHLETARAATAGNERWLQVMGEVIGIRGALGIALGGQVQGGSADELAHAHYQQQVAERASEFARCSCSLCLSETEAGR